jgi:hypothetical protein
LNAVGDPAVGETSRKELSAFLAEHEDCGEGFEIQRRQGSDGSIVRVICGGCSGAIEYPAAAATEFPADPAFRRISRQERSRERSSASRPKRPREPAAPRRLPGWVSAPLVVALIGGGALLIVLGVAQNGGTSDSTPDVPGGTLSSVPLATPTVPINAGPAIKLDRRRIAERVSIGIPAGWNAGVVGPAVSVSALNGRAEVQVYFEHGARPDDQLMSEARTFLLQRHAGAQVAAIGPADLGGRRVRRVRVVYPSGSETATVLVAGGYSYLVLERLAKPFSQALRRTTDAVTASFRPA